MEYNEIVDITDFLNLEDGEEVINMQRSGYKVILTTSYNNIIFLNGYSYTDSYSYEGNRVTTAVITQRLYNQDSDYITYNIKSSLEDLVVERDGYTIEGLYFDYTFTREFTEEDLIEFFEDSFVSFSYIDEKYIKWIEE